VRLALRADGVAEAVVERPPQPKVQTWLTSSPTRPAAAPLPADFGGDPGPSKPALKAHGACTEPICSQHDGSKYPQQHDSRGLAYVVAQLHFEWVTCPAGHGFWWNKACKEKSKHEEVTGAACIPFDTVKQCHICSGTGDPIDPISPISIEIAPSDVIPPRRPQKPKESLSEAKTVISVHSAKTETVSHGACTLNRCPEHKPAGKKLDRVMSTCRSGFDFNAAGRPSKLNCHLCLGAPKSVFIRGDNKKVFNPDAGIRVVPSKGTHRTVAPNVPLLQAQQTAASNSLPLPWAMPQPLPAPRVDNQPVADFLPIIQVDTIYQGRRSDVSQLSTVNNYSAIPETMIAGNRYNGAPYPPHDCLLRALEPIFNRTTDHMWADLQTMVPSETLDQAYLGKGLSTYHAHMLALRYDYRLYMHYPFGSSGYHPVLGTANNNHEGVLIWTPTNGGGHFTPGNLSQSAFSGRQFVYQQGDSFSFVHGSTTRRLNEFERAYRATLASVPNLKWHTWTPDRSIAKKFWNAYTAHEVGIAQSHVFQPRDGLSSDVEITRMLETATILPIQLGVIEGLPGSGKSRPIIDRLKALRSKLSPGLFAFGFPRVFLRTDVVDKFKFGPQERARKNSFRTWEHILTNDAALAIFDEYSLFPPGYFDFYAIFCNGLQHMLLLGDPTQGAWAPESVHARMDHSLLSLPTNKARFSGYCSEYRFYTYRMPQRIAQCFGVHSLSSVAGTVDFQAYMPPHTANHPVLCPSDSIKGVMIREGYAAYTYTEVQGAEFPTVVLKVSNATLDACSYESIWTAITRTTNRLIIQCDLSPDQYGRLTQHPIFGPLLGNTPPTTLFGMFGSYLNKKTLVLPSAMSYVLGSGVDRPADVLTRWSNERADYLPPAFKANLPVVYEFFAAEPNADEPNAPEPTVRTHLPPSMDPRNYGELEPVLPREDRELVYGNEMSSQFIEGDRHKQFDVAGTFFPRQSAKHDPTLFRSAIKTRFKYAKPEENEQLYQRKSYLGPVLFGRFQRYLGLPEDGIEFCDESFTLAVVQTIATKLDKPIATIWNNVDRSEPDWARNYMHAFVKSQHKAKAETGARSFRLLDDDAAEILKPFAKPGQPLVTSPDVNVFEFGPWTRYMRAHLYRLMRRNIYIHGGRTLQALNAFAKEFSNMNDASTCDFTQYDMSCSAETLAFEMTLFSYFSLDLVFPELYKLYYYIKTHMFTQLGTSAIMRFTGEFGTYDFNTWYNIAYMALRYDLDRYSHLGAAFSGDDSIFFFTLVENHDWYHLAPEFELIGKLFIGPSKDFCGWWLLPCGAVRNPILLVLKIMYQRERNNLEACLDSYFLEALYAHNAGDSLFQYVPALALEAQSWIINFCFKHAKIVPHLSLITGSSTAYDLTNYSSLPIRILKQLLPRSSILSHLPFRSSVSFV